MAVGHVVGLFLALYRDDLRVQYILLHHNGTDLADLSRELRNVKGAYTWFLTVLVFMIIGILLQKFVFKTDEPSIIKTLSKSIRKLIKH